MIGRNWTTRLAVVLFLSIAVALHSAASAAAQASKDVAAQPGKRVTTPGTATEQPTSATPRTGGVDVEPIRCWWKTGASAILIGERFALTLTCALVQTPSIRAVMNLSQLQPTAIQLPPFEVVSGVRHEDLVTSPWRYVQHQYVLRLLGDAFFGKDVDIPALTVTYHIESSIDGGSEGRDNAYVLPPLPLHVLTLLTRGANDIRDASRDTFAEIEVRRDRSASMLIAATILFAFSAVFLALAAMRLITRSRVRAPGAARGLQTGAVLAGCAQAVRNLRDEVRRDGWAPDHVGRALASLRVASAVALGEPVSQDLVDAAAEAREGQLVMPSRLRGGKRALVSAPTTAEFVATALRNGHSTRRSPRVQAILGDLQGPLRVFTAARYGSNERVDGAALDAGLDTGANAIRRLQTATSWPVRVSASAAALAARIKETIWFL